MEINASHKLNDNKIYLAAKCPYVNKISLCCSQSTLLRITDALC